jgi:beta-glucosidase
MIKPVKVLYGSVIALAVLSACSDKTPYRDLNKNGKRDIYEDAREPIDKRIDDLLKQMTLEEKAGMLFINGTRINSDGSIEDKPGEGMFAFAPVASKLMTEKYMTHFNVWAVPPKKVLAWVYKTMQMLA